MTWLAAVSLVVLCACSPTRTPVRIVAMRVGTAAPVGLPGPPAAERGTIRGRVLLDGVPVTELGIGLTRQFLEVASPVRRVHTADGRFTIDGIIPSSWHVAIVVPEVGWVWAFAYELAAGGVIDLGDLHVRRGRTVRGVVRDPAGVPVSGAIVRIGDAQRGDDRAMDALTAMTNSVYTTRTAADGSFTFAAVATFHAHAPPIAATHGRFWRSQLAPLPPEGAAVELTLRAAGAIDGSVGFAVPVGTFVAIEGPGEWRHVGVGRDGRFHADHLAPGRYRLQVLPSAGAGPLPTTIEVAAGEATRVAIAPPRDPVTIAIAGASACGLLTLTEEATRSIVALAPCDRGRAEITGVEPGRYLACTHDSCTAITVAAAPPRQTFALPP